MDVFPAVGGKQPLGQSQPHQPFIDEKIDVELIIHETGEHKQQPVYMGDFPTMTERGTFIINGAERVVVSQLVRSPGVYYTATQDKDTGRNLFSAKVIPNRGAWLEFETSSKNQLYVKVDRKRKLEATKLLRAVGYESNEEMIDLFKSIIDRYQNR